VFDQEGLSGAVETCKEILRRFGAKGIFLRTNNAGHPGEMLPLKSMQVVRIR